MSSKDDGKGAEPDPQNGKRCSLSSESSDGSSSSSEGETPPPNKRPRKTRGEFPQVMYDPRVDTLTSQISDTSSLKRRYVFGKVHNRNVLHSNKTCIMY
ncbi:uncharacterized protein LOC125233654 isoform X2 [Leguminivora glycinivorella]|uniref:uncharacterized protein LOC125233654 isoform X2 n=1 Tax=Leguminivora glycinivorella TaxID=1035111 RepID=UPI002010BE76|nr:uncharacterized protein LOC125233654 isoform X2 [Leguminivora glycinivorella]